jgi:hypothetical protein
VKLGFLGVNILLFVFGIAVLILMLWCCLSCSKKTDMSGKAPFEVREIIKKLNSWDKEELDVLERPDKHPGRIASGETKGWVDVHKQKLKGFGFTAQWDTDKKSYELVKCKN